MSDLPQTPATRTSPHSPASSPSNTKQKYWLYAECIVKNYLYFPLQGFRTCKLLIYMVNLLIYLQKMKILFKSQTYIFVHLKYISVRQHQCMLKSNGTCTCNCCVDITWDLWMDIAQASLSGTCFLLMKTAPDTLNVHRTGRMTSSSPLTNFTRG